MKNYTEPKDSFLHIYCYVRTVSSLAYVVCIIAAGNAHNIFINYLKK